MMWKLLKSLKPTQVMFLYAVATIIVTGITIICLVKFQLISTEATDAAQEIDAWFYFLSGVGTATLAGIAWIKVGAINKQNEANFLLHIDERWGSPQSIRARVIIHELYMKVIKANEEYLKGLDPECKDEHIQSGLGEIINDMRNEMRTEEKFIHLINFLDFMETIGYLESKGFVASDELDALCGEALLFNYNIFKEYIDEKRKRHDNPEFYKNFENLFKKLYKEKQRKKLETLT